MENAVQSIKNRLSNNMNVDNEKLELEEYEDEIVEPKNNVLGKPTIEDEILTKLTKQRNTKRMDKERCIDPVTKILDCS